MMVLLTKEEYDELVKKATAAELIAEEKLEALKNQFAKQAMDLIQRYKHDRFFSTPMHTSEFLNALSELVKKY